MFRHLNVIRSLQVLIGNILPQVGHECFFMVFEVKCLLETVIVTSFKMVRIVTSSVEVGLRWSCVYRDVIVVSECV